MYSKMNNFHCSSGRSNQKAWTLNSISTASSFTPKIKSNPISSALPMILKRKLATDYIFVGNFFNTTSGKSRGVNKIKFRISFAKKFSLPVFLTPKHSISVSITFDRYEMFLLQRFQDLFSSSNDFENVSLSVLWRRNNMFVILGGH